MDIVSQNELSSIGIDVNALVEIDMDSDTDLQDNSSLIDNQDEEDEQDSSRSSLIDMQDEENEHKNSRSSLIDMQDEENEQENSSTSLFDMQDEENEQENSSTSLFDMQDEENEQACVKIQKTRIRSKKADPKKWKNNIKIDNRMKGQEYVIKKKNSSDNTVRSEEIVKPARKIGDRCKSKQCAAKKKCQEFSDSERSTLFLEFWNKTWTEKKLFVQSIVDVHEPAKRKQVTNLKRETTLKYHLKLDGVRSEVCRTFFLSTLGLKKSQLYNWVNEKEKQKDKRARKTSFTNRRRFLNNFFNKLPKMPSHYIRQNSTKSYLEPIIKSKQELRRFYNSECTKNEVKPLARCVFEKVFNDMNLSVFCPKKDQCDLCVAAEIQNPPRKSTSKNNNNNNNSTTQNEISQTILKEHLERKNQGRKEKKLDKKNALEGKCYTLTVDVEQVKLSPYVLASKSYFKQKLSNHNYSVYNLGTKHVMCYWWDETQGGVDASNFSSCIIDYLEENCLSTPRKPIVIWSDGCASQNRNSTLSNALNHFAVKNNVTVTQKILEKGHTQMEVDSVHGSIEGTLKRENIHLPSDYVTKTEQARHDPFPYGVKSLNFEFFKDYSNKLTMKYKEIRPGKLPKDPKVTDLHVLQYTPDGKINYKLKFSDNFKELPHATKSSSFVFTQNFPQLHSERLPITDQKYKDLQDLKSVIPSDCHSFYDEIPKGKEQKEKKNSKRK